MNSNQCMEPTRDQCCIFITKGINSFSQHVGVFFFWYERIKRFYLSSRPVCRALMWLRSMAFSWLCDFHQLLLLLLLYSSEWVSEMKRISFHSFPNKNAVGFVMIEQIISSRWAPYGFPYRKSDLCCLARSKHVGMEWKWKLIHLLCLTYK